MNTLHSLVDLDLNLLVAFVHLAETRSVTRTAERMHVTQSAMSHALRRLREQLDDPLLVRTGATMSLTPRAEALVGPVQAILNDLARVVSEPDGFEPARACRTFRITAPDLFDLLLLGPIWRAIHAVAPGVTLTSSPVSGALDDALAAGTLDLAVVPVQPELPSSETAQILRRTLFRDHMMAFVRPGHALSGGFDLEAFLEARHVLVSPTGSGPGVVDVALSRSGHERQIAVRVPHFASAVELVRGSDLVLCAPASLAKLPSARLTAIELPFDVPGHGVAIAWHRRFTADPGHRWLRDCFAEVSATIGN
jgi:DNA-binding transcriptional LysR family regulator